MAFERHVFIPDLHIPYEDGRAVDALFAFLRDYKPNLVVLLGDVWDLGPLSKYAQDPRFGVDVEEQRVRTRDLLNQIRDVVGPDCRIVYVKGNHESRIDKNLMRNNPQLMALKSGGLEILSVRSLLGLDDLDIEFYDETESVPLLGGYTAEHGDRVSSQSGATAKAMVDARLTSVIHGHSHRLGEYWKSGAGVTLHGIECGHLSNPKHPGMAWAGKDPNWQTGFAIGEAVYGGGQDLYQVTTIPIKNGRFIWNNRVYSSYGSEDV